MSKFRRDNSYCAVPQCNSTGGKNPELSFFTFPRPSTHKNPRKKDDGSKMKLRKEWLRILKINKEVSNRSVVCSKHFKNEDFKKSAVKKRRLHRTAVPSLCLPVCSTENNDEQLERQNYVAEDEESFPKNPEQRKRWIAAVKRKNWEPSKCSVLCSKHFSEDQIDRFSASKVRLKDNAVPNIFPAYPSYLQKDHFQPDQFEQHRLDGWKKLKPSAVPTIFNIQSSTKCDTLDSSKKESSLEQVHTPNVVTSGHISASSSVNSSTSSSHESIHNEEIPERSRVCEMHFADGSVVRTVMSKLFKDAISVIEKGNPVLRINFVPTSYPNLPVDSSTALKSKLSTPHIWQAPKKQNSEVVPTNVDQDASDNIQNKGHEDEFSYIQLTDNLDCIHKPNSWWTVSPCQDFIACAKWDNRYYCDRKVIIHKDLTVKVLLRDIEIPSLTLNTKICSISSVSALLHSIDKLVIYQATNLESV